MRWIALDSFLHFPRGYLLFGPSLLGWLGKALGSSRDCQDQIPYRTFEDQLTHETWRTAPEPKK